MASVARLLLDGFVICTILKSIETLQRQLTNTDARGEVLVQAAHAKLDRPKIVIQHGPVSYLFHVIFGSLARFPGSQNSVFKIRGGLTNGSR